MNAITERIERHCQAALAALETRDTRRAYREIAAAWCLNPGAGVRKDEIADALASAAAACGEMINGTDSHAREWAEHYTQEALEHCALELTP